MRTYIHIYIHTYTNTKVRTHLVNLHPVTPVSFSLSRQQFVAHKSTLVLTNLLLRLCVRKWNKKERERAQTHTHTQAQKHTHKTLTHARILTHSLTQSIQSIYEYQPTN